MLLEEVEFASSDNENILMLLPTNEKKELRKALRKEIREIKDSELESESTESESKNYPDCLSQSEKVTDREAESKEESEDETEEES